MAQDDIYNSQQHYDTIVEKIRDGSYLKDGPRLKYIIKNPENIKYFEKLIKDLETRDLSFIRRKKYLECLRMVGSFTDKDLKDITRDDVKEIIRLANEVHITNNTRRSFLNYGKNIWKVLFPEKDYLGRPDDSVIPHAWRIKFNGDKSREKDRKDKLTPQEYVRIQRSLNRDARIQFWNSLIYENLVRPQEASYIDIKDVEVKENYARIRLSSHTKEGVRGIQIIEGYGYLVSWLSQHPDADNPNSPLFVTLCSNRERKRLTPRTVNFILRKKLKELGINKPIRNYSLKRSGVTNKYLTGESPAIIQKQAGWRSVRQLQTYDISEEEDWFQEELVRKGIIKGDEKNKHLKVTIRHCNACNEINPASNDYCSRCKRPLDRSKILEEEKLQKEKESELNKRMQNIELILKIMTQKPQEVTNYLLDKSNVR